MKFYLNNFSAICSSGIFTKENYQKLDEGSTALDIGRKSVYSKLHTGFGKLNPPDKLAFCAASLILDNNEFIDGEKTGISIGTTVGSLSTDIRYMESVADGFPRPAYFQATLPSSAVAEVAIMFKLKGPDRTVVGTQGSGAEAFSRAIKILERKKAGSMLFLFTNGIDPVDAKSEFVSDLEDDAPFSVAFLISKKPLGKSDIKLFSKIEYCENKNISTGSEISYFLDIIKNIKENNSFNSEIIVDGLKLKISSRE